MTFQQAIQAILMVDTEHGVPVITRRDWGHNSHGFKFDEFGALRCAKDVVDDARPYSDEELLDLREEGGASIDGPAIDYCLTPEDLSADDWMVC